MLEYDVVIIGGAIAGSCAAKDLAEAGLKTLLVEKYIVPRNKSCSGIQWTYFEKLIGEKIPKERLCNYQIENVHAELPDGFTSHSGMKMLNFMRKPLGHWLNLVAQEKGANFWDNTNFLGFTEKVTHIDVHLIKKNNVKQTVTTRYLIDATGLRPVIRKILRQFRILRYNVCMGLYENFGRRERLLGGWHRWKHGFSQTTPRKIL